MTSMNPKGAPAPAVTSGLPSRIPVQWVAADDDPRDETWLADWGEEEDLSTVILSDLPEVHSTLPEEVEARDLADEDEDETELEEAPAEDEESPSLDDDKKRGRRRSKTIARKQMLRERRRMLAQGTIPEILEYDRPIMRSECREGARPCLYVSCRYHLYLDVNPVTGSIKLNFPDKEVWELEETCALDVAERGGITLEEVGEIMNLTRERIRQVEVSGLEKLKDGDAALHTFVDGRELEIRGPSAPKSLKIIDD